MLDTLERPHQNRSPPRNYISYSAIKTYAGCPLRYYFRYVLGLSEPTVAASLLFGTSFHSALEGHYRALLAGEALPGLDGMLDRFWAAWEARESPQIQFGVGETLDTIGLTAERMLRAFMSSELARAEGTILGIEEELRGPLVAGLPDLLARVDLILDTPEAVVVRDFKSSRTSWDANRVVTSADQLLLYSELTHSFADGKPVRLEFAVFTKTKIPSVTRFVVHHDATHIERTKRIVEHVWHAIDCEHFYPVPSYQCSTCPFRAPCGRWVG